MVVIRIIYCEPCGWKPQAEEMAEALRAAYRDKVSVAVEASGGGRFEVLVSENLVFSRLKMGRFPAIGEIKVEVDKVLSKP